MKTILIRVYVAYLAAAQKLFKDYGGMADPWMTLVGYFNSMRELGGMRRVTDDAVRTRLRQMDARGLVKRFIEPDSTEELTSRKSAVDIPRILDRLEKTFPIKKGEPRPYDVVSGHQHDLGRCRRQPPGSDGRCQPAQRPPPNTSRQPAVSAVPFRALSALCITGRARAT